MRERMPFAVVGSNMTITDPETGLRYRGREYPWGCVNIEDKVSNHSVKSRHSQCKNVRTFCELYAKSGDQFVNMLLLRSMDSVKELLNPCHCCWRFIMKPWLDIELIATSSPAVSLVNSGYIYSTLIGQASATSVQK